MWDQKRNNKYNEKRLFNAAFIYALKEIKKKIYIYAILGRVKIIKNISNLKQKILCIFFALEGGLPMECCLYSHDNLKKMTLNSEMLTGM